MINICDENCNDMFSHKIVKPSETRNQESKNLLNWYYLEDFLSTTQPMNWRLLISQVKANWSHCAINSYPIIILSQSECPSAFVSQPVRVQMSPISTSANQLYSHSVSQPVGSHISGGCDTQSVASLTVIECFSPGQRKCLFLPN